MSLTSFPHFLICNSLQKHQPPNFLESPAKTVHLSMLQVGVFLLSSSVYTIMIPSRNWSYDIHVILPTGKRRHSQQLTWISGTSVTGLFCSYPKFDWNVQTFIIFLTHSKCIQNTSSRDAIISKLSIHVKQFWTYLCDVKIIIKVCMLDSCCHISRRFEF